MTVQLFRHFGSDLWAAALFERIILVRLQRKARRHPHAPM
jgi:hypothetical protein